MDHSIPPSPRQASGRLTYPSRPRLPAASRGWPGARVSVQVLGLISTMILARLLTPADFGLIAMAMSVVALLETLSYFGFEMPLIHKQDATRADFDTAWTLNIILAAWSAP
jgi:lipopolysaccharide exporter